MLFLRKLGVWQSLYIPASMHGAAICQNIWTCRSDWRREVVKRMRNFQAARGWAKAGSSRRGGWLQADDFRLLLGGFCSCNFLRRASAPLLLLRCSPTSPLPPCLWKKVVALLPHREHYYYTITFGSHLAESLANASSCFAKLSLQLKMALLWQRLCVVMDNIIRSTFCYSPHCIFCSSQNDKTWLISLSLVTFKGQYHKYLNEHCIVPCALKCRTRSHCVVINVGKSRFLHSWESVTLVTKALGSYSWIQMALEQSFLALTQGRIHTK